MDIYNYRKYSRYVKQFDGKKSSINLFLTLKGCRNSCLIHINRRFMKSFDRILNFYDMKYVSKEKDDVVYYAISKKRITDDVKISFLLDNRSEEDHNVLGIFLEYPYLINISKIKSMKSIGGIKFIFKSNKKKETIYGFRIPTDKINQKIIQKMNLKVKKYKKCVKKYLSEIYRNFSIELDIN